MDTAQVASRKVQLVLMVPAAASVQDVRRFAHPGQGLQNLPSVPAAPYVGQTVLSAPHMMFPVQVPQALNGSSSISSYGSHVVGSSARYHVFVLKKIEI